MVKEQIRRINENVAKLLAETAGERPTPEMEQYQSKRRFVKAIQWRKMGDHPSVVNAFRNGHGGIDLEAHPSAGQVAIYCLVVKTFAGFSMSQGEVRSGDWIIQGDRSLYVKSDDWFRDEFERLAALPVAPEVRAVDSSDDQKTGLLAAEGYPNSATARAVPEKDDPIATPEVNCVHGWPLKDCGYCKTSVPEKEPISGHSRGTPKLGIHLDVKMGLIVS